MPRTVLNAIPPLPHLILTEHHYVGATHFIDEEIEAQQCPSSCQNHLANKWQIRISSQVVYFQSPFSELLSMKTKSFVLY